MVALMGEFDDDGRLCFVHGIRSDRWTREEFLRQIVSYCERVNWWPTWVVKEKFGQDTFLSDVRREFLRVNHPVHCETVPRAQNQAKNDFIVSSLQGPYERGEIVCGSVFPATLHARLKLELTQLGSIKNDDVADCAALFMAPKIRVVSRGTSLHGGEAFDWQGADMSTYNTMYDHGARGTYILAKEQLAKESNPLREAHGLAPERIQFALGDFHDATWAQPAMPENKPFNIAESE